jgi:glycosyltransferase involved in cell wall biosynthesis
MQMLPTTSPKITIVSATLNAASVLPRLLACLRAQTDRDFEWVVADGGSTDGTQALLESATDLRVHVAEAKDFGIYDALNRALQLVCEGYYLVVGADDTLDADAVANFRRAARAAGQPDFIAAAIRQNGKVIRPRRGWGWLYGIQGVASSHAVGLLIKRDLHRLHGMYSSKFPIAADQLFVKSALAKGASIERVAFVAGEFSVHGTSGNDPLGVLTEIFRCQVRTERFILPQYLIFLLRLTKLYLRTLITKCSRSEAPMQGKRRSP